MPKKLSKNSSQPSTSTQSSEPAMTTNGSSSLLPASLTNPDLPLPRLIIFDLDYTLWPFWVDTHVTPPLKPNAAHSSAADRYGEDFSFYVDVPEILYALPRAGMKVAVASRTSAPSLAKDLLKMLHIPVPHQAAAEEGSSSSSKPEKPKRALEAFDGGVEAYPGSKVKHMEVLHKRTGIPYTEMLFFDDESRNRDTESLGVTMHLVRDGVSWGEIEAGVQEWRRRRGYIQPEVSNGANNFS
ncbi:acid phosphatase-domain-containing protein [Mariannaea sp. PMI_226]|nr:acid phosphatase-domain-containing protein [Mariannaea sp. PMI_226]